MSGMQLNPEIRTGKPRRKLRPLIGLGLLCAVLGCGEGPPAEFSWRPSTTDMIPAAKKAVQEVMKESFGTPQQLVAWERMPVDFGGVRGDVAAIQTPGGFTLGLADPALASRVKSGMPIVWLTGPQAESKGTQTAKVESFDPKSLLLVSTGGEAAVGDKLLVGYGSQLQLGRVVYMKNCTHCHGVAGDGMGPTANYLNPRPRDFRLGIIKFTSTLSAERAARDDIHRIITNGIPGTYMPSFLLMAPEEKLAAVEYVRWLAMRGEMEKRLGDELADYNEVSLKSDIGKQEEAYQAAVKAGEKPEKPMGLPKALATSAASFKAYQEEDFPTIIDETADFLAETWQKADDPASLVTPQQSRVADSLESRQRGRRLYMSDRTKCYTCHGPLGRGDGGAVDDFWPKPGTTEKYAQRGLHDLWGNKLQPRDLTKGQYRGGRRPLDLYRRMFAGIKGTPMPAFGGTVLKDEEIWDLVNYVMSIPFESRTPSKPPTAAMASMPPESKVDH